MTKSQKEETRRRMMWVALFAIICVMFGLLGLVYVGKTVADLSMIASSFFGALAGLNGANFFSTPSEGADDKGIE
jgi:Na+/proline symporter